MLTECVQIQRRAQLRTFGAPEIWHLLVSISTGICPYNKYAKSINIIVLKGGGRIGFYDLLALICPLNLIFSVSS